MSLDLLQLNINSNGKKGSTFFPGDSICGSVFLNKTGDLKSKSLIVELIGRAQTDLIEGTMEMLVKTMVKKRDPNPSNVYQAEEEIISYGEVQTRLFGDGNTEKAFPQDEMRFHFVLKIPKRRMLPTLKWDNSVVWYWVQTKLTLSSSDSDSNPEKEEIQVRHVEITMGQSLLDLNTIPGPGVPLTAHVEHRFEYWCCFWSNPLSMTIRCPQRAFCLGDIIPLEVYAINRSSRKISDFSARLIGLPKEWGYRDGNPSYVKGVVIDYDKIAEVSREEELPRGEGMNWIANIQVPTDIKTTMDDLSEILQVEYEIHVEAEFEIEDVNIYALPLRIGGIPKYIQPDDHAFIQHCRKKNGAGVPVVKLPVIIGGIPFEVSPSTITININHEV